MRRFQKTFQNRPSGGQDVLVLALLGAIWATGFLVEGLRILLTAVTASVAFPSFIGYPLSFLLGLFPFRWEGVYPYGWYVHGILTGLFIITLPFRKMFHIFVSPRVLFMNSVTRGK